MDINLGRIISIIVFKKTIVIQDSQCVEKRVVADFTRKVYSTVPCIVRYTASFWK